jgi:hypothetical protein
VPLQEKKNTLANKNPLLKTSVERVFNPIEYIPYQVKLKKKK